MTDIFKECIILKEQIFSQDEPLDLRDEQTLAGAAFTRFIWNRFRITHLPLALTENVTLQNEPLNA